MNHARRNTLVNTMRRHESRRVYALIATTMREAQGILLSKSGD
jgi:hypothetical protein